MTFTDLPRRDASTPSLRALGAALLLALGAGGAGAQDIAADAQPDTMVEQFRDWVVRCAAANGLRNCEMAQEIRQRGEGGRRVLTMAVQRPAEEPARMTLIAPFGLQLAEGMTLTVDDADTPAESLGFLTCMPDGCIVSAPVTDALAEALRAGTTLQAGLVSLNGEGVSIGLSLAGFTAAWERLGSLR